VGAPLLLHVAAVVLEPNRHLYLPISLSGCTASVKTSCPTGAT